MIFRQATIVCNKKNVPQQIQIVEYFNHYCMTAGLNDINIDEMNDVNKE